MSETRLNPSQGTEICELLRKYNKGEWWFDSAGQRFNHHSPPKLVDKSMTVREALNLVMALFRRMETEKETVLNMLPHYDSIVNIWRLCNAEIQTCFDEVYPGCVESLEESEMKGIIEAYKKGVATQLDDWQGILRDAIKQEAPRTMEIESWPKD